MPGGRRSALLSGDGWKASWREVVDHAGRRWKAILTKSGKCRRQGVERVTGGEHSVATVSSTGVVTAVGYGTTTIIVTTVDQGKTATCTITAQYTIGQTGPGGGLICYDSIVSTGSNFSETVNGVTNTYRYLECAPSDQGTCTWWNTSNTTSGTAGTAIGTGGSNTTAIVADQGSGTYAASICKNYSNNGKSDWFLPSQSELNTMYSNLGSKGLAGFTSNYYWSSSGTSTTIYAAAYIGGSYIWANYYEAWAQNLISGGQTGGAITYSIPVRAIRAF